ncbi:hypothetical protein BST61_g3428 [Cercospora zeina]
MVLQYMYSILGHRKFRLEDRPSSWKVPARATAVVDHLCKDPYHSSICWTVAQRNAGTLPGQPHRGLGLVGCEVEEYPFGNSLSPVAQNQRGIWANRAVLRLVPWEENRDHGNTLGIFIAAAQRGDPNRNLPALSGQLTYCIKAVIAVVKLMAPDVLLVNDISAGEARQHPNESRWDPWFDKNNQLFDHTIYSSGQSITTTALPSQYGLRPAPGLKTFTRNAGGDPNSGTWSTVAANGVTVGAPEGSGVPGARGQNLKYNDPASSHPGIWKRCIDIQDLGHDPRHPEITLAPTPYVQARRPMGQTSSGEEDVATTKEKLAKSPSTLCLRSTYAPLKNAGRAAWFTTLKAMSLSLARQIKVGLVNGEGTGDETLSSSSSIASETAGTYCRVGGCFTLPSCASWVNIEPTPPHLPRPPLHRHTRFVR